MDIFISAKRIKLGKAFYMGEDCMRTHCHQTYDALGKLTNEIVQPWGREDYLSAIRDIEESITTRMRDEAILGTSTLLSEKRAEIDALREEMKAI